MSTTLTHADCFIAGAWFVGVFGMTGLAGIAFVPLIARTIRRAFADARRARAVYICHPFADDPAGNTAKVLRIARGITANGYLAIAPHLYLPQLLDEATDRERALRLCQRLVESCDIVHVYGTERTPGMELEIAHARARGILVAEIGGAP